jgi:hypothetical protein
MAAAGIPLTAAPASAGPAGFPTYAYLRTAFDKSNLTYNPTGEFIFPCIRGTAGRLSAPLAKYYLYYAPHDAPGGICLAYSDSIEGPYTEYAANPVDRKTWSPHYDVSHVSSPHVMWNSGSSQMWLYFHGENDTTRLARSSNGIDFSYDRTVVTTAMLPSGVSEASYARVFEQQIASRNSNYVMVLMGNQDGTRKIFWGWSADGRTWTMAQTALVSPGFDGTTQLSSPHVLNRNGTTHVVCHANTGKMYLVEVGNDFSGSTYRGVFHTPRSTAPDSGRSAAPSFGSENGVQYMIYEAGTRLSATIAVARGV